MMAVVGFKRAAGASRDNSLLATRIDSSYNIRNGATGASAQAAQRWPCCIVDAEFAHLFVDEVFIRDGFIP